MDREIYYLEALEDPAVPLDGLDERPVRVRLQEQAVRVVLHEIQVLVCRTLLVVFRFRSLESHNIKSLQG